MVVVKREALVYFILSRDSSGKERDLAISLAEGSRLINAFYSVGLLFLGSSNLCYWIGIKAIWRFGEASKTSTLCMTLCGRWAGELGIRYTF